MQEFDVIVIGAGAAGLMCAIEAGRRERRVLVLDHADRAGKKILISGGGRANFTNLHCGPENFLSGNRHFAKSALAQFTPADMVALIEKHGIAFHEKTLGQLFCDRSARDLVDLLERECATANVLIQLETRIERVNPGRRISQEGFSLTTSAGLLETQSVVVATGGLSIPKMGATGWGYELAQQFGLRVVPCRPGLVPFTFGAEDQNAWCDLAGVSTDIIATVAASTSSKPASMAHPPASVLSVPNPPTNRKRPPAARSHAPLPSFREKVLITHRGLSGPAILQISSFWNASDRLILDLAPGRNVFAPLLTPRARRDSAAALAAVRAILPGRWAERWLTLNSDALAPSSPDLNNASIAILEDRMHDWTVVPNGTEGYAKAEVTTGGIDTAELDARTMQSHKVPGLFFIGEVVDVTGWLGGFNFQWAWASGFSAGQVA